MTDSERPQPRTPLFPEGLTPIQLYRAAPVLAAAVEQCVTAGWQVVEVDAGRWSDRDAMHDDLAAAFAFPDWYGRNLDALLDAMRGLPTSNSTDLDAAPGLAVVIRRLDALASSDARLAQNLVEIMSEGAHHALRFGWPVSVLLQSDDGALQLAPLPPVTVVWNRAERNPSDRV